jgi:hypothetical protein
MGEAELNSRQRARFLRRPHQQFGLGQRLQLPHVTSQSFSRERRLPQLIEHHRGRKTGDEKALWRGVRLPSRHCGELCGRVPAVDRAAPLAGGDYGE